jgi:hypothetical protein
LLFPTTGVLYPIKLNPYSGTCIFNGQYWTRTSDILLVRQKS